MTFAQDLESAAKTALCGWLANGGNAVAATWIVNGSKTPATAVAGAAAALGLLAVNYGCNYDPNAGIPGGDLTPTGCWKAATGNDLFFTTAENSTGWVAGGFKEFISIVDTGRSGGFGTTYWRLTYKLADGQTLTHELPRSKAEMGAHYLRLRSGKLCATDGQPPPVGVLPPTTYTNSTTNCTYVVSHQGWVMRDDGTVDPVLKIEPGAQLLASGGVIGGCNFPPVVYSPGGPVTVPWTPGPDGPDGEPWWWDVVKGAGGAVLGGLVNRLIDKLLEEKAPATVYRVVSVCETDDQGEPISQSREVVIPSLPVLDGLVARVDAMDNLMQGLKDFKQPICPTVRPKQQGDWVTVNFVSDEPSPGGEKRLRKRLRYRDLSATAHLSHVHHWEEFEWQAGPVCVISKGLEWGVPQVWAATEAEGKRVIAYAAAVAGVNLADPRHEWVVTGSPDARYGQPGTMRVQRRNDGWIRVSKRDGPSGLPKLYGPPAIP